MKGIKLIRELNENIREKDEFEKALHEAGIEFDMGDGDTEQMDDVDAMDRDTEAYDDEMQYERGGEDELRRIADAYRPGAEDMGQGSASEMSDDELRDAIGNDLEMLEYSPEEISDGIEQVMAMLGRGDEEYDEPDVDERQELEDFEQADEYFGGGDERM